MQSMCKVNGVSVTTGLQMSLNASMKATTERQPLLWFRRPNRSSVFALRDCTVDFLHDLELFIWVCHLLFSAPG